LKRTILAAFFAIMAGLAGSLPAAVSAPRGAAPAPVSPEASVPAAWARYSEQGSRDLLGVPGAPGRAEREMSRLADRLRPSVAAADGGAGVVDAFRRILLQEEGFAYDRAAGNPENYLLDTVLARRRGNCLGLSLLWLALAERLDVPFRGVYVPGHCFVRYEGEGARVNVEFTEGGAAWEDERYRREFRLSPGRPYLRSLSAPETVGVFLKSLGAAYSRNGHEEEALRLYEEAALLYPGLPDVHYNAGVSLQKLGRTHEAMGKYRRAIALDPEMAAPRDNMSILLARNGEYAEAIAHAQRAVELEPWNAATRGNLASAYCACGNYDEGIREFRKAADLAPGNARVRAGLTRAYFARGAFREAARECDAAEALGCRFEPSMLEVLSRYREGRRAVGTAP